MPLYRQLVFTIALSLTPLVPLNFCDTSFLAYRHHSQIVIQTLQCMTPQSYRFNNSAGIFTTRSIKHNKTAKPHQLLWNQGHISLSFIHSRNDLSSHIAPLRQLQQQQLSWVGRAAPAHNWMLILLLLTLIQWIHLWRLTTHTK